MKILFYISMFTLLISCGKSPSDQNGEQKTVDIDSVNLEIENKRDELTDSVILNEPNDLQDQSWANEFKKAKLFLLDDTIISDFNGDGKDDRAIFVKEQETSGIIIKHGGLNEEITIGFGEPFAHLTDFNWVDYWGVLNDSVTFEIIFGEAEILGDRAVKLEHPSIFVRKEEASGGIITYKDGKYVWIHQSD